MIEMMLDLETLDVKSSAVVLSVGAVTWDTFRNDGNGLKYEIVDRFYRVLDIQSQLNRGRTLSEATLLWWMHQDQDAKDEAFSPVRRGISIVMDELQGFVDKGAITINKFWASPVSFDFGIWNSLADDVGHSTPWKYNQVYDVRTVLNEASYSARDHKLTRHISGKPHMPVYDCEWQIDELTAARNKIGRRMS